MKIVFKREIKDDDLNETQILQYILEDRKIENIAEFQNPPSPITLSLNNFGFKKELAAALNILERIRENKQKVVVYTDYDADGITGGAILWETLHLMGFDAIPYVPHRKLEGYGFSVKGIDHVKKEYNPSLIISVDHGITAAEKITYAKSLGIPIIVTDHHLKSETPPDDALAVFHLPQLSGSSVSYFFSKALFEHFSSHISPSNFQRLTSHFATDYLALASIGTIADLVPLVGPARSIVKYGLAAFPKISRAGIQCILQEAGIAGKAITPYEVGFIIGPRINAVGRLEHAIDALRLLCTTDRKKAETLAADIGRTNQQRQELVKKALEEAEKIVAIDPLGKIIILTSKHWHEGIIGLIASKITERYFRPTIVMTEVDGFLKGSARSIPSFHITNFLKGLKDYLIDVGGHTQASGFTIDTAQLSNFITEAQKRAAAIIRDDELIKVIEADVKLPIAKVSRKLVQQIEKMQPFGIGNPQPVFFSNALLINAQIFGKRSEHLKMIVREPGGDSFPLELIAFSRASDFNKLSPSLPIDIVYKVEIDRWNGAERLRGKLIHWHNSL
ncbi:single-stranded-DNA-specific exonuclease RecJ [Candidatus Roizmanbacteria bacterium]|nr:single-stranded-DNA-specific exonuclease RecJ [Candidatus Roizmanbacteria bacterium]